MKLLKLFSLLIMIAVFLAACTPGAQNTVNPTSTAGEPVPFTPTTIPTTTPQAEPGVTPTSSPTLGATQPDLPEAVTVVLEMLSARLGIDPGDITVVSAEQVQWPDGCLGAAEPGEMCTQAIVDGYKVVLQAGGQNYEFHTNMDGTLVREAGAPGPKGADVITGVAPKARQFLSQELGLKLDDIRLQSSKQVDWPDSCLGAPKAGQVCAQVITPGYQIIFEAGGKQYEVRTDMEGGLIILAGEPEQPLSGTVLTWEKTENGQCSRLEAGETLLVGACGGTLEEVDVSPERVDELRELNSTFAPFQADTEAGSIEFTGQGDQDPAAAEQRSVAEWAWMVFQEAQSGSSDESLGVVLSWRREGGIAGFCDDLVIYASGWARASNCRANNSDASGYSRLNPEHLSQLYQWADQIASLEVSQKDPPGAADAMTVTLTFQGRGTQKVSAANQQEMLLFAQEVYTDL